MFLAGLRATLLAAYAGSVDSLANLGLVGPKLRVVSPKTQIATAAEVEATRVAHHTVSPKQKKGVKGAVTGIVVTPVTAPKPAVSGGNSATASGVPQATASPPQTGAPAASTGAPAMAAGTVNIGH